MRVPKEPITLSIDTVFLLKSRERVIAPSRVRKEYLFSLSLTES
ncbi:unknown [Firmicutes bacterium CAG:475]|nr:unknown [Firmicutes bacterium CAG:475]